MPGLTIDKFDIGIYIQYARRTQLLEQVRQQYHMPEAGGVPAQTLLVDLYPKLMELDLLLGIPLLTAPWAYFFPPKSFVTQRRSPFTFHRIIPIMEKPEKDEEGREQKSDQELLEEVECKSSEELQEKGVIRNCLKHIEEINSMLRYIGGRIGQFLQG